MTQLARFSVGRIAAHTIGTTEFFAAVRTDEELRRYPGQAYWSWPQWDRFFALAEEHGMTAVHESHVRGEKRWDFAFRALGSAILEQWRRVRKAKRDGMSSYEFYLAEERRTTGEAARVAAGEDYRRKQRLAVMQGKHHDVSDAVPGGF